METQGRIQRPQIMLSDSFTADRLLGFILYVGVLSSASSCSQENDLAAGTAAVIKKDYQTAHALLVPLAEQGVAMAQSQVGRLYLAGRGVSKNPSKATNWFRLAAEQGLAEAQFLLGMNYYQGKGGSQDFVLAYFWMHLSEARVNPCPPGSNPS